MQASAASPSIAAIRILRFFPSLSLCIPSCSPSPFTSLLPSARTQIHFLMEPGSNRNSHRNTQCCSSSGAPHSSFPHASQRSFRGGGRDSGHIRDDGRRGRGAGGSGSHDRIDALGRLMTRILRHMASELNLNIRSDGYVRVRDLLQLNVMTYAKIPLKAHTVDEVKEAVRRDNKQRFSLLEDTGELLIRANQGHSIETISSECLLRPILPAEEISVCVHGTYKKNMESILQSGLKRMQRLHVHFASGLPTDGEVISGMRNTVNILIFLDVKKALQDGMKLYMSDNKVILTEGFDGVVPVKYFEKIETWPKREDVPFQTHTLT